MDLSVVVAVGSFVVSERVLKPKATALFILGCLLAYDLKTKTHDISSLRVYRGPALLAFTLMMAAYSLRTWRRNGVACDELLFLPGTLHGHENGVEGPLIEMPTPSQDQSEADMAAGGLSTEAGRPTVRRRTISQDGETEPLNVETSSAPLPRSPSRSEVSNDEEGPEQSQPDGDEIDVEGVLEETTATEDNRGIIQRCRGIIQRWRENHPRLDQLWTFFFDRGATAGISSPNATYAPSGPAVFGAGLDLSMPVLFNFHLYILAYNHIQGPAGETPAKILPVCFLSVLFVRMVVPPNRRFRFWNTLKFTFTAPLHHVRFRDEFIGEVMTSWIRPGQDLLFALSYYLTVIFGTLSGKCGLEQCGAILEDSWLLHNVILPSLAILPLWLKYLQTLRQAYDANKRWPYQGNSFKYLSATLVIIYGVTHPDKRTHPLWVTSFALTLLYQIFWDTFMDWEMFEIQRDNVIEADQDTWCSRIQSFSPNSRFLRALQMYILQPLVGAFQRIPSLRQIRLRQKRLYKDESFYWKIFAYNTIMRFTWMMCLIPSYHVSRRKETVLTSTSDINSYWGVLLPVAEIVRRTLWGFLFVERETIKLMDADSKYSRMATQDESESDEGDDGSKYNSRAQLLPAWLDNQQQLAHNAATSRAKQRAKWTQEMFVVELYIWAIAFVVLGCWAAT
jgi:hypothetical protein